MSTATLPTTNTWRFSIRQMFVALTIFGGLCGLVAIILPVFRAAQLNARQMAASNNVKNIVLALYNYQDAYKTLPPAVTYDPSHRAMFGWRYSITAFVDQIGPREDEDGTLSTHWWYQIDHSQPWDAPANLAALQGVKYWLFHHPAANNPVIEATNFVAVVGPGTLFPDGPPLAFSDVVDDPSTTIVIVEIDNSNIPWYEPRDLRIDNMSYQINDRATTRPHFGNRRTNGALFGMADGSVKFLPQDTPPETLKAMLTIAGGEKVTLPGAAQ